MPGAQCTRSLVCAGGSEYAHQYSQRRHRKHPAFPTQWFYGLLRALPGDEFLFATVVSRIEWFHVPGWVDKTSARLSISNGCQDHTTSPYAQRRSSCRCISPGRRRTAAGLSMHQDCRLELACCPRRGRRPRARHLLQEAIRNPVRGREVLIAREPVKCWHGPGNFRGKGRIAPLKESPVPCQSL
jgi:hypothetical protein